LLRFEAKTSTMKPIPRSVPSGRQPRARKGSRQSRLDLLAGDQSEPKDTSLRAARRNPTERPLLEKIKSLLTRALLGWVLSPHPHSCLPPEYKPTGGIRTAKVLISLPAQPVDATPSSALIRHCLRGRTICLAALGQNLAVPPGLTLASGVSFCFQCQAGFSSVSRRPIETTRVTRHLLLAEIPHVR